MIMHQRGHVIRMLSRCKKVYQMTYASLHVVRNERSR